MIPCHPCGMVMDLIRTGRRCWMQLWQDDPTLTRVRWFRCSPGARPFLGPTRLRNADWYKQEGWSGVGEVYPRAGGYDKGVNWAGYLGLEHCGPVEAMRSGGVRGVTPEIVTRADGTAECCDGPPFPRAWVRSGGRPAAAFLRSGQARTVGRASGRQAAANGIEADTDGASSAAGRQGAANGLRGLVAGVALPAAQLLAGVRLAELLPAIAAPAARQGPANRLPGLADAVARPAGVMRGANGAQGPARSVARPTSWNGPRPHARRPVGSIGRVVSRQWLTQAQIDIVPAVGLPVAVTHAGPQLFGLVPAIALPGAKLSAGPQLIGLAPAVALPDADLHPGRHLLGLADAVGRPDGVQGGASPYSYRSSTSNTAAGTSITLDKPTGTVAGDIVYIAVASGGGRPLRFDLPSGFTSLYSITSFADLQWLVCYKVAGASEPASYTVTGTGSPADLVGTCQSYGPFAAQTAGTQDGTSGSTATAPSVTLTGGNGFAVVWYACNGPAVATGPSGYTLTAGVGGATQSLYSYRKSMSAGASGAAAAVLVSTGNWLAAQVVSR